MIPGITAKELKELDSMRMSELGGATSLKHVGEDHLEILVGVSERHQLHLNKSHR